MRGKARVETLEKVEIVDLAAEGHALGRYDGKVVFVKYAAPGDVVDVRIVGRDKKYFLAIPTHFHTASTMRTVPQCGHFGTCGGCKWQHIEYKQQLAGKEKHVRDCLDRIAKVPYDEFFPILGAPEVYGYRNKMEFTFSSQRWIMPEEMHQDIEDKRGLGFHISGKFDKVLDLAHCHLHGALSERIRAETRRFCLEKGYTFFDLRAQTGLLRTLLIRTATTGHTMVLIQFFEPNIEAIEHIMDHLHSTFPQINSLLYAINEKKNDTLQDVEVITYRGAPYIEEKMEDLTFRISAKSFFQTNSLQALELYKVARAFADIRPQHIVYDLYTGTGTIANFVAKQSNRVVGIEYVEDAVKDARINSEINGITNTAFHSGDMAKIFTPDFVRKEGRPDVIITDPPRAGMHGDVIKTLMELRPSTISYVSCNPATQARDLQLLESAYQVIKVQPVDMFPQTHHVENVVQLKIRQ